MQQGKINETLFHSCLSFYIKLIKTGEKQKNSGYDSGDTKEMYRPFLIREEKGGLQKWKRNMKSGF